MAVHGVNALPVNVTFAGHVTVVTEVAFVMVNAAVPEVLRT